MQSHSFRFSQVSIFCLSAGLALLAVGVVLLTTESLIQSSFGADVGPWGANFVLLGAIAGAYGVWKCWPRPRHDGAMSLREKAAAFSLAASGLLVVYLLSKSQTLTQTLPSTTGGMASAMIMTAAVVLGILIAETAIVAFLKRGHDMETLEDERDAQITQKASEIGHCVLVTVVIILAVQLGIGSAVEPIRSPNEMLGLSSPLAIAHNLMALLFVSQGSKSIAELWLYRRARA